MISKRTAAFFGLALLLSIGMGSAVHRRDIRCMALRSSLARSAPWFSARGGAHGFDCGDYDHIPLPDKAIAAAWCLSILAMLRSLAIDIKTRRQRWRADYPDEPLERPPMRDAFSDKSRPGR